MCHHIVSHTVVSRHKAGGINAVALGMVRVLFLQFSTTVMKERERTTHRLLSVSLFPFSLLKSHTHTYLIFLLLIILIDLNFNLIELTFNIITTNTKHHYDDHQQQQQQHYAHHHHQQN